MIPATEASPPPPNHARTLTCLPYARGGVGIYESWAEGFTDKVNIMAVFVSGRGHRLSEAPSRDWNAPVDRRRAELTHWLEAPHELLRHLFHRFGGRFAFQVTQEFENEKLFATPMVVVSAHRSPRHSQNFPVPRLLSGHNASGFVLSEIAGPHFNINKRPIRNPQTVREAPRPRGIHVLH